MVRCIGVNAIRPQINAFLEGFNELIPRELVSIFNDKELELLISGLPEIDFDDLTANTPSTPATRQDPMLFIGSGRFLSKVSRHCKTFQSINLRNNLRNACTCHSRSQFRFRVCLNKAYHFGIAQYGEAIMVHPATG
ncbi:hypothetical protein DY000_02059717 [Brassica cretica]|uniref:HECT-type E3 ubiquitin transferase n=1 Tax=Brassica cretica TaxID=69181 RepID=A0ABQ7B0E6_BRACR|nr:hypothetical protein DY000_02059717 [Brassica cretica]